MKIEVGKFYKTRDGHKVRIYAIDGYSRFPIHGAKLFGGDWIQTKWEPDGFWNSNTESVDDIVSEWSEPKPKLKAWIVDGKLEFQESDMVFHFKGCVIPNYFRAPWLDEPGESA